MVRPGDVSTLVVIAGSILFAAMLAVAVYALTTRRGRARWSLSVTALKGAMGLDYSFEVEESTRFQRERQKLRRQMEEDIKGDDELAFADLEEPERDW